VTHQYIIFYQVHWIYSNIDAMQNDYDNINVATHNVNKWNACLYTVYGWENQLSPA